MKAFQPHAGSQTLLATAAGATSRVALPNSGTAWRVFNASTATLFLAFGDVTVNAVAPTAGVAGGLAMAPGSVEVFSLAAAATHVAVLGSGAVYFTPGEGI